MPANSSNMDKGLNTDPQLSFIPDAGLLDPLATSNSPQNNSASSSSDPLPPPPNTRPQLQWVNLEKPEYRHNETLKVTSGQAVDPDGFADLAGIDFQIRLQNGSYVDIADTTTFQQVNSTTGSFSYEFDLSNLNLSPGNHQLGLFATAYDQSGQSSNNFVGLDFRVINTAPDSFNFNIQSNQSDGIPLGGNSFLQSNILHLENNYLVEYDGVNDVEKIDFILYNMMNGTTIDIADVTNFRVDPNAPESSFLTFDYSLDLSSLGLAPQERYDFELRGTVYDKAGNSSPEMRQFFEIRNLAPENLGFALSKTEYSSSETLTLDFGHLEEYNGIADLDRIDFQIRQEDGTLIDVNDVTNFLAEPTSPYSFSFNYSLDLGGLNLIAGNYTLEAIAHDKAQNKSNPHQQNFTLIVPQGNAPESLRFALDKTTYSPTESLKLTNGWVEDKDGAIDVTRIELQLLAENDSAIASLGNISNLTPTTWDANWASFTQSLNLSNYSLSDGTYAIAAIAYDSNNSTSNTFTRSFQISPSNTAPSDLQFRLDKSSYSIGETLNIRNAWVSDSDGIEDINEIELHLRKADGTIVEVPDALVNPASWSPEWGSFNHSISLNGFEDGTYTLVGVARDRAGSTSNTFERTFTLTSPVANTAPTNLRFNLDRTSYSETDTVTLNNGWVSDRDGGDDLSRIELEIVAENGSVTALNEISNFSQPTWDRTRQWLGFNYSFSLGSLGLSGGQYRLRSRAYDRAGDSSNFFERSFFIL